MDNRTFGYNHNTHTHSCQYLVHARPLHMRRSPAQMTRTCAKRWRKFAILCAGDKGKYSISALVTCASACYLRLSSAQICYTYSSFFAQVMPFECFFFLLFNYFYYCRYILRIMNLWIIVVIHYK